MELTGLATPSNTHRLMGNSKGVAHHEAASQMFGWVTTLANLVL
jgi:hypothetical protein